MKHQLILAGCILIASTLFGQSFDAKYHKFDDATRPEVRTPLRIPNLPGYKTLKCDFHIHTIFSDGDVLPAMRVSEAWCEGLDAIAITDHNKYKADYLAADYNKSVELAKERGAELGLIVIKGAEYTDRKPVGHLNFLFIDDANQYDRKLIEPDAAVELAASRGAFIMYNHPGWPDKNSDLSDFQKKFIAQKKIGGIEVFNQAEFYPQTIDHCLQDNLAVLGCSDSHGPINFEYDLTINKRPMTLVFAKEATEAGIKEALFAGRTVAFANHILAGKEEYIQAIYNQSFQVEKIGTVKDRSTYNLSNVTDIPYYLEFSGNTLVLPAGKTTQIKIKKEDLEKTFSLKNCYCGANKNVKVRLPIH